MSFRTKWPSPMNMSGDSIAKSSCQHGDLFRLRAMQLQMDRTAALQVRVNEKQDQMALVYEHVRYGQPLWR